MDELPRGTTPPGSHAIGGSGVFGEWVVDDDGLPAYRYTCDQTRDPRASTPTSTGESTDHWHQLGNRHLTLTCHNDGRVEVILGDRGLEYLSYKNLDKGLVGGGVAIVRDLVAGKIWTDLHHAGRGGDSERLFGTGYFKKVRRFDELRLEHAIFPTFGDDPVVASRVRLTNESATTRTLEILETWDFRVLPLIVTPFSLLYLARGRRKFGQSKLVNFALGILSRLVAALHLTAPDARERFASKFKIRVKVERGGDLLVFHPRFSGRVPVGPGQRSDRDYFPPSSFLALKSSGGPADETVWYSKVGKRVSGGHILLNFQKLDHLGDWGTLAVGRRVELRGGEGVDLEFSFGVAQAGALPEIVDKPQLDFSENCRAWKGTLCRFLCPAGSPQGWLSREIAWHSHGLLSSALFDSYFGRHFLPQGNAYAFLQGIDGAVRDYVLFSIPATFLDPALARESLLRVLEATTPEGKLPYAFSGFGQLGGAMVHESSSDLYIFLAWGIMEYVYLTRDFDFLDARVTLYPPERGETVTVWELLTKCLRYLLDGVGFGEHGLVRVGSGDWSDGISLFVGLSRRRGFLKRGESVFNSAFLVFVLQRLLPLLEANVERLPSGFPAELRKVLDRLSVACRATWNGRWCLRAWDGHGNPVGDANLFLEHHPWFVLANILPPSQRRVLVENIHSLLDAPSPIGQLLLRPTIPLMLEVLPEGWDVNGGVWHAVNSLLTWAYSKVDPGRAWNSLLKNSMARHAEVYPETWYGIWSGPDAYNAHYSANPGQTFVHPATPQADFPVMNLNLHAGVLHSLFRLSGVDSDLEGIVLDPKVPGSEFDFRTPLVAAKYSGGGVEVRYSPVRAGEVRFRVKLHTALDGKPFKVFRGDGVDSVEVPYAEEGGGWVVFRARVDPGGSRFSIRRA
ncbi:MAG: GH36-type glycosyl hydrolase domain-containing protein [Promethearchaeota archaeon]